MSEFPRVPVVFLAGLGRSGSTLLDRLLGQVPGWWSLGEVVHLWQRGLVDNERCGCGERFWDCPVWQAIGREAFGGWDEIDPFHVLALQSQVARDRHLVQLAQPRTTHFRHQLDAYNQVLTKLYRGTQYATGARYVLDSSKHVSMAQALRHNTALDLSVVHLVRDSRGVAYSWAKSVPRPATDGTTMMTKWSPLETSMRYVAYNSWLRVGFGERRLVVRYEDLTARPTTVVASVLAHAGDSARPPSANSEGSFDMGPSHGISGNPMRGTIGAVKVRVDDAWMRELSDWDRRLVSTLTAPSLLQYGYPLRTGTGSAGRS